MPAINVSNLEEFKVDEDKLQFKCPKGCKAAEMQTAIELLNWRFAAVGKCSKCKSNILFEIIVKKTLQGEIGYKEISSVLKEDVYLDYMYKFYNIKERKS